VHRETRAHAAKRLRINSRYGYGQRVAARGSSAAFGAGIQLGDKAVGKVGRARQARLVPTGFFRSDAGGAAFTVHDLELVHRSPARVQHMINGRRQLEDSVDAVATIDGLAQIQLRHTHIGAPKAFGFNIFRKVTMQGAAVAVSILQHGNR
jgi:hypothetical protein